MELLLQPIDLTFEIRCPLDRQLTTLGSDPSAQVRLAGLPAQWALVQREEAAVELRLLASGETRRLAVGESVTADGLRLTLLGEPREPAVGLPIQPLVDRLSDVERPEEALSLLLDGLLAATGADYGAVILREGDGYAIAVMRAREGEGADGRALLSDHMVREVLRTGLSLLVQDAERHDRYSEVPSVVALGLRSVLCVPLQLYGAVLGALFLGKRASAVPFRERQASDLALLASMAVPFLVQLRRHAAGTGPANEIVIGECEAIRKVHELIERVAPSDLSVLIQGETGTGKELVARAIHVASPRAEQPMVAINCSAVPESLLEAELFGCKRGAYTGAVSDRKGRIEQANGSTLFLDEVGEMPLPMQAALLRVLEDHLITRLGENEARKVDFRLITATHRDLDAEVAAGRFRKDLLYRLREFTIVLPPLARRSVDILLLAQLFLRQAEQQLGLPAHTLAEATRQALLAHPWPGNVRELRATMRRAAILCDGRQIEPEHLCLPARPTEGGSQPSLPLRVGPEVPLGDLSRPLEAARDQFITRYVAAVLERHGGDRAQAAAALGISVRSLYRYLSIQE